ncbi:MAG TPA: VOC family protein, partial [Opitutales bacterium]|nr:VOC family protein [Opitutales bacterium]
GAEIDLLMHYKDSPQPVPPDRIAPGFADKVMHASFRVGATHLMASDGDGSETGGFKNFMLSLVMPDEAAANRAYAALSAGGKVIMPLGKTFWSPCFGMLTDRFGLGWMVTVPPAQ